MLPQIQKGVMNSWHNLKNFLKEEEIVRYSNGWNTLLSKPQIKKIKEYRAKKREANKEEATVASTSKPQSTHFPKKGRRKRKRTGENHIPQATGSQKSNKMPWTMSSTWPKP
ncbi:hypothetical protein O181_120347 [Austropuccinia psidii MF-1]|uniref:Uncharacterized protein n=1 Tax=Austropuccinia psidii MF-1 TaxID=1389203 RepID=A0A9Q3KGW1_9BASI|nr:hypothetical protein [Austropuccinia psidii MF-1]